MSTVELENQHITPGKLLCVGRNFQAHIDELQNETPRQAVIFIKPASAISRLIKLPAQQLVHYETELCFLLQKGQPVAAALGLDLTLRQLQQQLQAGGLPWERAKAFRGSALFSPFIRLKQHDISQLHFSLHIDGALRQQGAYAQMRYKPPALIEECERVFGVDDNDILMTGTPAGVGPLQAGMQLQASLYCDEEQLLHQQWQVFNAD